MPHASVPTTTDLMMRLVASNMVVTPAVTVTAASNANPVVITTSGNHGLQTNQWINLYGVQGNTAANGVWQVTVLSPTTFSIPTAGNGAWTAGGTFQTCIAGMIDLASKLELIQDDFENRIGRPIIAVSATKVADTNGSYVLPLPTSLYSLTGLTISNGTYVLNKDFYLYPSTGPPYEWIRFLVPTPSMYFGGFLQTIQITGLWGMGTNVPNQAWQGLLSGAQALCVPEIASTISQGLQNLTQGPSRYQYSHRGDAGVYAFEMGLLQAQYENAITKYTRRTIGWRAR